jgi:hypothetical protein
MSHTDRFENEWIEVSFTSKDEKADERLLAVAAEYRRRGEAVVIVTDDNEGIRLPLRSEGHRVTSVREFSRLLRGERRPVVEIKGESLDAAARRDLEREFLARDEVRKRQEEAPRFKAGPRAGSVSSPIPGEESANSRTPRALHSNPRTAGQSPPVPLPGPAGRPASRGEDAAETAARRRAKKLRGLKKQARRLALVHSRSKKK